MARLSYSCSVRKRSIFGMANWVLWGNMGICCCKACMTSWAILASSVWGLTMKGERSLSSTSSILFPRLPSRSRLDSILLTLTRNTVGHARSLMILRSWI